MANANLAGLQRGSVAVVGAAESDLGQVAQGTNPMDLMAQATMRALEDCGLTLKDVDGLFCRSNAGTYGPDGLCGVSAHQAQVFRRHQSSAARRS